MAPVKKQPHERKPHFLKEWRKYRGISQEEAADRVQISRSQISKYENNEANYVQDVIEKLADLYGCEVSDLLGKNPNDKEPLPIFDLPEADAQRVHDFIRALRITHVSDPGEHPTPVLPPAKPKPRLKDRA